MDLNPQQIDFLSFYTNPNSETFGNALQSALRAKYSQEYAESITAQMPDWLSENLGDMRRLNKAEKNLEIALEGGLDDTDKGKKEIQYKATEFTLKALRKAKYSERMEHTGKDGQPILVMPQELINKNAINTSTEPNSTGSSQI